MFPDYSSTALIAVDPQVDFCEGGALPVSGAMVMLCDLALFIRQTYRLYGLRVASRDWHSPEGDNGGHFSDTPDWKTTWPRHCVADTEGAEYHMVFPQALMDEHFKKGFGEPAYSAFDGVNRGGQDLDAFLRVHRIKQVDVVGLAMDYCVFATAMEALDRGYTTRILTDLCSGINKERIWGCLKQLREKGAHIISSFEVPANL